jgi:hypothetical protein
MTLKFAASAAKATMFLSVNDNNLLLYDGCSFFLKIMFCLESRKNHDLKGEEENKAQLEKFF